MKRTASNWIAYAGGVALLVAWPAAAQAPQTQPATGAKAHATHAASEGPAPDATWAELVEGNTRFVAGRLTPVALVPRRAELAQGQHPKAIVLACSDSRVAPELVFDQSLGDLFVVRTAGNLADAVALGSIEYAVEHLGSRLIVVLGHQKCGAVAAACSGGKMPTANLDAVVRMIAPAAAETGNDAARAVGANVRLRAQDLVTNSPIVHEAVMSGKVKIVQAVYSLDSGRVELLASDAAKPARVH